MLFCSHGITARTVPVPAVTAVGLIDLVLITVPAVITRYLPFPFPCKYTQLPAPIVNGGGDSF